MKRSTMYLPGILNYSKPYYCRNKDIITGEAHPRTVLRSFDKNSQETFYMTFS